MQFGVPMVWREQKNHYDDCYFCMVKTEGFNAKNKNKIVYPDLESARRPVLHCKEVPVPVFTHLPDLESDIADSYQEEAIDADRDSSFLPSASVEPLLFD